MVLYIASDAALPLVPWDEKKPGFNVALMKPTEAPVRQHFSRQQVVYAGAHTECGCGFNYGLLPPKSAEEKLEHARAVASVAALRAYLRQALQAGPVEVYSCWSGDEDKPTESQISVGLDHFGRLGFELVERQLMLVRES